MTLLEELRSPSAQPNRQRARGLLIARVIAIGVSATLLAALIGALIYRSSYQPLERGSLGGGVDSGLLQLSDGLETTRLVVAEPGKPGHFIFSVANRGRYEVKVLSIGDSSAEATDSYFDLAVARMGNPRSQCCTDYSSLPFAPFVLEPGHERFVEVTVVSRGCTPREGGGRSSITSIPVSYQAWGHRAETSLPLSVPVVRTCQPGQLHPHVYPPYPSSDDQFVPSLYNFGIPRGWTAKPLENLGGPASFASWTSPDGKSKVVYEENGGMAGVLYDESGQPTEAGARAATGCDKLEAFRTLGGGAFSYSCRPVKDVLRSGFVWVHPYPQGFERVEIASADQALVADFLKHVKV